MTVFRVHGLKRNLGLVPTRTPKSLLSIILHRWTCEHEGTYAKNASVKGNSGAPSYAQRIGFGGKVNRLFKGQIFFLRGPLFNKLGTSGG